MHTITVALTGYGTSTAMRIPAQVAHLLGFVPGVFVKARLTTDPRSVYVTRPVISLSGGKAVGILVPADVLKRLGWEKGDKVDVPFMGWTRAEKPRMG